MNSMGCRMAVVYDDCRLVLRGTPKGPVSGLIPTGRGSDHESPMSQMDIHVIGLQIGRSKKALFCEFSCLLLSATLQNRNAGLSKIFLHFYTNCSSSYFALVNFS